MVEKGWGKKRRDIRRKEKIGDFRWIGEIKREIRKKERKERKRDRQKRKQEDNDSSVVKNL